jgi:hypothetical protein
MYFPPENAPRHPAKAVAALLFGSGLTRNFWPCPWIKVVGTALPGKRCGEAVDMPRFRANTNITPKNKACAVRENK